MSCSCHAGDGRTNDVFFDADFVNAGDLDRVGAVAGLHDGQVHGDALATPISISESPDGAPKLPRQSKIAYTPYTAFKKFPHFDCHGKKDGIKNDFSPIRFSDPDYQRRLIHLRL